MAPIAAAAPGRTPAKPRLRRLEGATLCVLVAGFIAIRLWNLTAAIPVALDELKGIPAARKCRAHAHWCVLSMGGNTLRQTLELRVLRL